MTPKRFVLFSSASQSAVRLVTPKFMAPSLVVHFYRQHFVTTSSGHHLCYKLHRQHFAQISGGGGAKTREPDLKTTSLPLSVVTIWTVPDTRGGAFRGQAGDLGGVARGGGQAEAGDSLTHRGGGLKMGISRILPGCSTLNPPKRKDCPPKKAWSGLFFHLGVHHFCSTKAVPTERGTPFVHLVIWFP